MMILAMLDSLHVTTLGLVIYTLFWQFLSPYCHLSARQGRIQACLLSGTDFVVE